MDNIPGFPDGISGHKLLDAQVAALRTVDSSVGYVAPARATAVHRDAEGFVVEFDWLGQHQRARGRGLILAMGVVDRIPEVAGTIETIFPWANLGLVYFCTFCDGHELVGRRVAVLGHDAFAARTALDLTHWNPKSMELLTFGRTFLEGVPDAEAESLRRELAAKGVTAVEAAVVGFDGIREKEFHVRFADGSLRPYDRGFSGLGWYAMNQEFPRALGCAFDADGYVRTDEDCRALSTESDSPIPGLYCIGDQRNGWNQIPEAWSSAERAVIHAYAYYL
jgi:thioredoxin reductase (NADPH)